MIFPLSKCLKTKKYCKKYSKNNVTDKLFWVINYCNSSFMSHEWITVQKISSDLSRSIRFQLFIFAQQYDHDWKLTIFSNRSNRRFCFGQTIFAYNSNGFSWIFPRFKLEMIIQMYGTIVLEYLNDRTFLTRIIFDSEFLNSIYWVWKMKIKSRDQFWNDFAVWSVLNSRMILDFTSLVNFWSVVV